MSQLDNLEKVKLGSTGLAVTKICFGTSALGDMPGTYGYGVDEERGRATVRAIFDGPANFLDTSRIYGHGQSELRIGDVIRERGGLPEGFVLSTKLDRDLETARFDAARARQSLEESLTALGIDQIPLLHLHDPEYVKPFNDLTDTGGAIEELFRMKQEGLTKAVGIAAGNVKITMEMLQNWDFDALITHNRFTLLNRNAEEMIEFADGKGVAVLNAAPYNSGVLAKGITSNPRFAYQIATKEVLDPVHQIEAICTRHNIPLGAAALQFSMRDPRITSTICGVSKPERVSETCEWANLAIPGQIWRELDALTFSTADPEIKREYTSG